MNEVTTKISAYLLQGYTLLDKYCEVCKTPLMSFKNEAEFCVFCDKIKAKHKEKQTSNHQDSNTDVSKSNLDQMDVGVAMPDQPYSDIYKKIEKSLDKLIGNICDRIDHFSSSSPKYEPNDHNQQSSKCQIGYIKSLLDIIQKTIEIKKTL
ncbi:cystatin-S-like [Sarcoptes scabiei]|nr:cystatin-S-like [Sarcoptes scabiei]